MRGLVAISFGALAFAFSGQTAVALVYLFGVYALLDGALSIFSAVHQRPTNPRWWALLLEGLAGVVAAGVTFLVPALAAVTLLVLAAVWAIITGGLEIISAVRLRREIENEWALGVSGVLSIALGLILLANPQAGIVSIVWLIGAYAILFGLAMIVLGFRIRGGQAQRAGSVS